MRKIRIFEHISLDGVIQHDNSDDFVHGGWTTPYRTPAGLEIVVEAYGTNFDLLLGRRTYDDWANSWPKAGNNPMANGLNASTKYVATHRPDNLQWGPVGDLGADILAGIRNLKATNGPDLIVGGSSTLTSVLLDQGLVDEVVLIVYPVLLGRGNAFFRIVLIRANSLSSARRLRRRACSSTLTDTSERCKLNLPKGTAEQVPRSVVISFHRKK